MLRIRARSPCGIDWPRDSRLIAQQRSLIFYLARSNFPPFARCLFSFAFSLCKLLQLCRHLLVHLLRRLLPPRLVCSLSRLAALLRMGEWRQRGLRLLCIFWFHLLGGVGDWKRKSFLVKHYGRRFCGLFQLKVTVSLKEKSACRQS